MLATSFGARQFLWKLVFLFGVSFRTTFLLLIIFVAKLYFIISSNYVWVVADLMRIIICSCIVTFSNLFVHWLGYVTVISTFIFDHLFQFGHLGGSPKHYRSTIHLLCLSCIWV